MPISRRCASLSMRLGESDASACCIRAYRGSFAASIRLGSGFAPLPFADAVACPLFLELVAVVVIVPLLFLLGKGYKFPLSPTQSRLQFNWHNRNEVIESDV